MAEPKNEHSRLNKIFLDAGQGSLLDAEDFFGRLVLRLHLGKDVAHLPAAQAAVLTALRTAIKCFRGGVYLTGAVDSDLSLSLPFKTVGEAARYFGASESLSPTCTITFGGAETQIEGWSVRAWWDKWLAGVRPKDDSEPLGSGQNVLAGVAAGSLAVAQAFNRARGDLRAGRLAQTLSLWNPADKEDKGESKVFLPKGVWLVGLGNLGQAYIWSLALLPFEKPEAFELVLQDFDRIKPENWGTSVLTDFKSYGKLKTKIAEDWALAKGFNVRRIDRKYDESYKPNSDEPRCILSGLDSLKVRRLLGGDEFDFVVDCGLGATAQNFHEVRFNVFDPGWTAARHFGEVKEEDAASEVQRLLESEAYKHEIERDPHGACGLAELAGASVAVPFVATLASAIAVAQLIRISSDQVPLRSLVVSANNVNDLRCHSMETSPRGAIYSEWMSC